ncbi:MAG: Gfo/Idh/MocA family oxidoreductase [Spirochaetales bacterium]|nr:Gfo/Idh/MocA family oxidoreductase [Spirochaetales bacterium]
MPFSRPVPTLAVVGAGDRGNTYARFALEHPERLRISAFAERDPVRRARFANLHGLPAAAVFEDWRELLDRPRLADALLVATPDREHLAPALAALERGYRVLLEKPMAPDADSCRSIAEASARTGNEVVVCHVLRYSSFFRAIRRALDEGLIGELVSIEHAENVAYWHMAHSYVRGSWGSSVRSSPMILAKCSHDFDLLRWFAGAPPETVASVGGLHEFRPERAPAGAPERCADGCPEASRCPYEATRLYLRAEPLLRDAAQGGGATAVGARFVLRHPRFAALLPGLKAYAPWRGWPVSTITDDLSDAGLLEALRNGPYGRCVYRAGSDQVDHQHTVVKFRNGVTASLTMQGHSHREGRTIRLDGTRGTLRGLFAGRGALEVIDHRTGRKARLPVSGDPLGHGEADRALMDAFARFLSGGLPPTLVSESLDSHLMAFAAQEALVSGLTIRFDA